MMVEHIAVTKLCPWAMSNANPDIHINCRASKCMAWSWEGRLYPKVVLTEYFCETEPERPINVPDTWRWFSSPEDEMESGWVQPMEQARYERLGFCQLIVGGKS